jgi:hypothetical protein
VPEAAVESAVDSGAAVVVVASVVVAAVVVVVVFASAFDEEESSELPQEANIALVSVSARAQAKNFFILITSV